MTQKTEVSLEGTSLAHRHSANPDTNMASLRFQGSLLSFQCLDLLLKMWIMSIILLTHNDED